MSVTFDVSHPPMFWLKALASENIPLILITLDVSQLLISWLKVYATANMFTVLVTLDVSQKPISELKELLFMKRALMSVTRVVHKFTFPLFI